MVSTLREERFLNDVSKVAVVGCTLLPVAYAFIANDGAFIAGAPFGFVLSFVGRQCYLDSYAILSKEDGKKLSYETTGCDGYCRVKRSEFL